MWLQRSSTVVISALDNRCWTLPDYGLDLFFLRPESIIGVVKSVFDTSQCRISSRNQIKTSHFGEVSNLLCKTPSSGKSSITDWSSQAVMGWQQGLQIWVWSSTRASHSCSELIWQTQTSGACGFSVGAEVNSLLPCMAAQKLLCHFLCVWVQNRAIHLDFGKEWVQVLVFYTACQSSVSSIALPCTYPK